MRINKNGIYQDLTQDEELNFVRKLSSSEQREAAYNSDTIIEWGGKMLTVTAAAQQWAYYAAEGRTDKTDALTILIASAKDDIRAQYPD